MFTTNENLHPLVWKHIDDRLKRYKRLLPPTMLLLFRDEAASAVAVYMGKDNEAWVRGLLGESAANAIFEEARLNEATVSADVNSANDPLESRMDERTIRPKQRERVRELNPRDELERVAMQGMSLGEELWREDSFGGLVVGALAQAYKVIPHFRAMPELDPDCSQALSRYLDLIFASMFVGLMALFEELVDKVEGDYLPALSAFRRAVRSLPKGDADTLDTYFFELDMEEIRENPPSDAEEVKIMNVLERLGAALEKAATRTIPRLVRPREQPSTEELVGLERLLRDVLKASR
jgi:hypothetical protein